MKNRAAVGAGDAKRAKREDLYQWKRTWYDQLANAFRNTYGPYDPAGPLGAHFAATGRDHGFPSDDDAPYADACYRGGNNPR